MATPNPSDGWRFATGFPHDGWTDGPHGPHLSDTTGCVSWLTSPMSLEESLMEFRNTPFP